MSRPSPPDIKQQQPTPLHQRRSSLRLITLLALATLIFAIILVPRSLPLRATWLSRLPGSGIGTPARAASVLGKPLPRHSRNVAISAQPASVMPPKSKADDLAWNRLAVHMDQFHAHFRFEFNRVYTLADGGFHREGMTLPRFLREAQQLSHHLDMHHRIESYIFPVLAKKMPQFVAGARESGEHLKKHKGIHDGLEKYDKFISDALENPSSYNPATLRAVLDGFREVLFTHLDEEVKDLGAESMKAAGWTLDEVKRIPM